MSLPSSGKITMGDIRTELKLTGQITLGQSEVRKLAGKSSGLIKMSDLYGKSFGSWVKIVDNRSLAVGGNGAQHAWYNLKTNLSDLFQQYGIVFPTSSSNTDLINKEFFNDEKTFKILIKSIDIIGQSSGPATATAYYDIYEFK